MIDGFFHIFKLLVQLDDRFWIFLLFVEHLVPEFTQFFLIDPHKCHNLSVFIFFLHDFVDLAYKICNLLFLPLSFNLLLANIIKQVLDLDLSLLCTFLLSAYFSL